MSVGPMGMASSSAGSPLAQSQGSDVNRAQHETAAQSRQLRSAEKAENAAGIGEAEQDEQTSDRDADGRRPWERGHRRPTATTNETPSADTESNEAPRAADASGQRGRNLDLSG